MEIIRATMEIVHTVILRQLIFISMEHECSIFQTVGIAAHSCTEAGTICSAVPIAVIIAQNDISHIAGGIGDEEPDKGSTVISYASGDMSVCNGVECSGFAGRECSKLLSHDVTSSMIVAHIHDVT